MICALVGYPLSMEYRKKIENLIGATPEYYTISELRKMPISKLFFHLRSLQAEAVYVLLEDENSIALLPILEILSVLCSAKRHVLVLPDYTQQKISSFKAFSGLVSLAKASVEGVYAKWQAEREINKLLQTPRKSYKLRDKKEVIYLKTNLWYGVKVGGSVGHVAGVVNELRRRDYQVQFVSAEHSVMIDEAVKCKTVEPLKTYAMPAELNLYRFSQKFAKQVNVSNFTVPAFIYQRMSLGDYTGPLLSRMWEVPLVLEYNGSEAWVSKNWGQALRYHNLAVKAEDACLQHAQVIVVVSQVLKDELISRDVASERIVCYPNCIDPIIFNSDNYSLSDRQVLRNKHGISEDAIVAAFVGTFGQWHGVEVLALAIKKLVDENEDWLIQKKLHFLLVGDGMKMSNLRQILQDEQYKQYITLTGLVAQNKAPAYLAISDILLSPHVANADGSQFFGSPTKLFEYMAMGKGIVASNLNQIGDILNSGIAVDSLPVVEPLESGNESAVLCRPGEVSDIIKGIMFLAENPSWNCHLGKNARRDALSKYTWNHHVDAILERLHGSYEAGINKGVLLP